MKDSDLKLLTADELVERFALIAVNQDKAMLADDIKKFTRLYWQMDAVENELKFRSGDQRRALLRLFNHPNMQARLTAAKATLAVAPDAAHRLLQAIADSEWQPQSGDAGMSLWNLEQGVFKPT